MKKISKTSFTVKQIEAIENAMIIVLEDFAEFVCQQCDLCVEPSTLVDLYDEELTNRKEYN